MGRSTRPILVSLVTVSLWAPAAARQDLTRSDAASMTQKVAAIMARGADQAATTRAPLRTSFTEQELNAYLQYSDQVHMPPGVLNPRVKIADGGLVSAHALVDLDAVRKSKDRSWLDPLAYVGGTVDVNAVGTLTTANGQGTFSLQSATLGGMSIPKSVLQELVTQYSKSADAPAGFELDKPFALPAAIRAVETHQGSATIVQ